MFTGARTARLERYELAMFQAWHIAQWIPQSQQGTLKDWSFYRDQLHGETKLPVVVDWQARKAQRAEQVKRLDKHKAKRQAPMRAKRG